MINNSDVSEFVGAFSNHLQILINRIASQETWSADNDLDVYPLIEELSDALSKTSPETLSKSSHLLLTNSAYFNFQRFLKFITFIAEKNPLIINQMLSPLNKENIDGGEVFLNTVVSRLRYTIQSVLVTEIFSPELMKRVQVAVLEYERLQQNIHKPPSTHTENDVDDILADDFESDMPFETSTSSKGIINTKTTDIHSVAEANTDSELVLDADTSSDLNLKSTETDLKSTETDKADVSIKAKIKKKAERPSYEFKKAQVLDLLNKLKEESEAEK